MKKTLYILLPLILVAVIIAALGVRSVREKKNFQKVTIKPLSSAIIGTSRASRLSDSVFNVGWKKKGDYSTIVNLAFNNGVSPYGPFYNEFLMNKIESTDSLNVFILSIDPWSLSENKNIKDQPLKFREAQSIITFSQKEGLDAFRFFIEHYKKSPYTLFIPSKEGYTHYETAPSQALSLKITNAKISSYERRHVLNMELNEIRIESFKSLVSYLSDKGQVLLVKLPVSNQMEKLENLYAPDFNQLMESFKLFENTYFLDFYPYNHLFRCPDGDHLLKKDAIKISQMLAEISDLIATQDIDADSDLLKKYMELPETQFSTFLSQ